MNIPRATLLQIPSGSSSLFFKAARKQQQLVTALTQRYDLWGYLPIHTPLLDFARPYQAIIPEQDSNRIYHLIGRDGEILMLRWDITLFLVKQIHRLLPDTKLPLRLSYADSILRHQAALDISHNEFFQTGVELIGSAGPDGDLEVVLLLAESLQTIGVSAVVHIGSAGLFHAAFGTLPAETQTSLSLAIVERNWRQFAELLQNHPTIDGPSLQTCFATICEAAALPEIEFVAKPLPPAVALEFNTTMSLVQEAQRLYPKTIFRLDLSELGSQQYHSGVVFQAYAEGYDSAVAMGGRYDRLLSKMGIDQPAVGFSIMLSKISSQLANSDVDSEPMVDLSQNPEGFVDRFRKAQTLRAKNQRVCL